MSYCRFGPDSDVYCYKSESFNYAVSVAGHRIIDTPMNGGGVMRQLKSRTNKIELPEAGTNREFCFPEHAYDFLLELREMGYMVPDEGLECLKKEFPKYSTPLLGDLHVPAEGDPTQASAVVLKDGSGIVVTPNSHRPQDGVDVDSMNLLELMQCEYVPLDLPHGGERLLVKTPSEAVEKLKELRSLGYEVTDQYLQKIGQLRIGDEQG